MKSILILGYGSIGRRHRAVLAELYPGTRIDVVSAHEKPREGFYPSLGSVHDIENYDYFIVASKTANHIDDLAAINDRVADRLILVEKPLYAYLSDVPNYRNDIYVGYNLRFHPILSRIKALTIRQKVLSINVCTGQYLPSWRSDTDYRSSYSASCAMGGGVLLDLSHELDYVQWLCGDLYCLKAINRKVSSLDIDSDDVMALVGQARNGSVVTISLDYLSRIPQRRVSIQTESNTIIADLIEGRLEVCGNHMDEKEVIIDKCERNYTYLEMHRSVVARASYACTLNEGVSVMRAIEMVRTSERMDWNV